MPFKSPFCILLYWPWCHTFLLLIISLVLLCYVFPITIFVLLRPHKLRLVTSVIHLRATVVKPANNEVECPHCPFCGASEAMPTKMFVRFAWITNGDPVSPTHVRCPVNFAHNRAVFAVTLLKLNLQFEASEFKIDPWAYWRTGDNSYFGVKPHPVTIDCRPINTKSEWAGKIRIISVPIKPTVLIRPKLFNSVSGSYWGCACATLLTTELPPV